MKHKTSAFIFAILLSLFSSSCATRLPHNEVQAVKVSQSKQEQNVMGQSWCGELPSGENLCCPQGYLLRPQLKKCVKYLKNHLEAIRTSSMCYQASGDNEAFVKITADTLELIAVHIIDDGEGSDCPHGPFGSLHYDLFPCTENLSLSADGADHRRLSHDRLFRGPFTYPSVCLFGPSAHREWLDDHYLTYEGAGLYKWGTDSCVVLRIWESDGSEDGSWGRRNDVLGMIRIDRNKTVGGVWFPLKKYTNDHPRKLTNSISGWVKLRTSTPKQETIRHTIFGE
jgi:hypothetical protein